MNLLEQLKNTGYDGVEIPIFEGKVEHYQKINKAYPKNVVYRVCKSTSNFICM